MSDDIVKRLRAVERSGGIHYALAGNCADEIERLRTELAAERERVDKMSAVAATERHRAAAEYERGFKEGMAYAESRFRQAIDAVLKETER